MRFDAEPLPDLVFRVGQHRLPLEVDVLRRAGTVPLRYRLLVAQQLANRLGLPDVHQGGRLGFHDHQRDAVDEEDQVGDDHALVVFLFVLSLSKGAPADPELGCDHELVESAF